MQLETERLILREMTEEDYGGLCRMLKDPQVMYAYEHAFTEEEARAWLHNQRRRYREDGFGLWAIIQKDTGEMIGQCGLTWQAWNEEQVFEVGYLLEKNAWHQGFATEAAKRCKRYAFDELAAPAVYSIIRDSNLASQNVAKRNLMIPKGYIIKKYYNIDMPHIVYGITREKDIKNSINAPVK